MSKSKAGIFGMFTTQFGGLTKTADFKLTTSYLAITFKKGLEIKLPAENKTVLSKTYQHISVPPDLNVHLSPKIKKDGYIFPKSKESLLKSDGSLSKKYFKLLTVCFPPISTLKPEQSKKTYAGGGLIIAFDQMPHWKDSTGYVFELFAVNGNHRNVPKSEHFRQDRLGTLLPLHIKEVFPKLDETDQKDYYLMPYFGEYDEAEKDIVRVYFYDSDKEDRKQ